MKKFLLLLLSVSFFVLRSSGQVVINEIQSANTKTITDEDGDYSDWLELYNAGSSAIDLNGYGLSDDATQLFKWTLPSVTLQPADHLLIFASGKDRKPVVDHYETVVYSNDVWKYFVGTYEPDVTWKDPGFDDSPWLSGVGGIGYGDGDDSTVIAASISLYMRKEFTIADTSKILQALLEADYDDAFVAYLNGVEIARSNIGLPGIPPPYDQIADYTHEAGLYQGYLPEQFVIDKQTLLQLLQPANNVLAIQVHNSDITSSDLSSNFFFLAGISDGSFTYGALPSWFPNTPFQLHTNFKISSTNETLLLSDPTGNVVDQKTITYLDADKSLQRTTDGASTWCVSSSPSPGDVNASANCYDGYLADPSFSVEAGFYSAPQTVTIFNNAFNSVIHYTVDGSIPDTNSLQYATPLIVDSTAVIKARAFPLNSLNFLPSKTVVNTYFINENTANAVISLSIDPFDLWDLDSGMYIFGPDYDPSFPYYGANFWEDWERLGYAEYFDANKHQQFELPIGLKMQGNWSKGFPQKSWQVQVHDYYGGSTINYQLFPDKGINTFQNFNLRNGGIDWNTVHFRDDLMEAAMRYSHVDMMSSYPCVVFLNGQYWGVYHLREREDEDYLQNNHGVDPTKIDLLRYDGDVMSGKADDFWSMDYFIENNDMSDSLNFETAKNWLDLDNFADYFISETYYSNTDWLGYYTNNIKYWRTNDPPSKWRYILWDTDGGLGLFSGVDYNLLSLVLNPPAYNPHSGMLMHLLNNSGYKNYFINRYADLMNTIFLPSNLSALAVTMRDSFYAELPRHFSRWGILNPNFYGWGTSYDMASYTTNFNNMLNFITLRQGYARTFIEQQFGLPGHQTETINVQPAGAGKIKISTLIPAAYPWFGIYFHGNPVKITAIPNAGYTFDHWEANAIIPLTMDQSVTFDPSVNTTFTAVFTGSAQPVQLSVSEIMYHPDSTLDGGDWFELHNYGTTDLDISDWWVKDEKWFHKFVFPTGTIIPVNGYLVVADDLSKFQMEYPNVGNVIGSLNFELGNDHDQIDFYDNANQPIILLSYADTLPWRKSADGWGRSLELKNDTDNPNDPLNWFDGCTGGSPGTGYQSCPQQLVFGEINYHSSSLLDAGDWIELYNYGSTPVDISNWKFTDDKQNNAFTFANGSVIGTGARLVLYNDLTKFATQFPDVTNINGPFSFALDGGGEPLRLYDENGKLYNIIVYDDQSPWPLSADGQGYTLELSDPLENLCDGNNYFAGCYGGSPGTEFIPCMTGAQSSPSISVSVYPNPTSDFIYLEVSATPVQFKLFDFSGREILESETGFNTTKIKTSDLAKGIYWYQVTGNGNISAKGKLIIQ